ncbi:MAG: hypothetical protein AAF497_20880 [Planctomycetota bacterium]
MCIKNSVDVREGEVERKASLEGPGIRAVGRLALLVTIHECP